MDRKEEFINIFTTNVHREGADKLLNWLDKSDFFIAPASGKFHNAFAGGLCDHSLNVYYRLKSLAEKEKELHPQEWSKITDESITIVALLHDLCKVNFYKIDYRNVKKNGVWESVPFYTIEEDLPYGHGEKSVYIANGFMRLSREEAIAINWHMGGFDSRVKGGDYSLSRAFESYPLATMLHIADIMASYFDENIGLDN